ncbi:MAG: Glu/Leu/Phe/Val dehydrogenase dimerization domain-containing protein, partial [Haloarculaceae archaeon]
MPDLTEQLAEHGHQEFKAFRDEETGLRGFIGIHDTTLGPAAGGTRRYAFESEEEAIVDVLRLSRAMTYKYAISGVNMGGAKAVIWVEDDDHNTEELYRSYGRMV